MMAKEMMCVLFESLELTYGKVTQARVADAIGVTQPTIYNWKKGNATPTRKNLRALLSFWLKHQAMHLVTPIVEFEEISPRRSGQGWQLCDSEEVLKSFRDALDKKKGLYIFYDSSRKATYLGKSETNLWLEIRQRLNAEQNRPSYGPTKGKPSLQGEVARYLSAYEVSVPKAIKNLESFMLRAFANDLTNKNGGNFVGSL